MINRMDQAYLFNFNAVLGSTALLIQCAKSKEDASFIQKVDLHHYPLLDGLIKLEITHDNKITSQAIASS